MSPDERNKRTAGNRRVNGHRERLRAKRDSDVTRTAPSEVPDENTLPVLNSLVLLLRRGVGLREEELARLMAGVFGAETLQVSIRLPERSTNYAENGAFVVDCGGWSIGVRTMHQPLFQDKPAVTQRVSELRLRAAMTEHAAYLVVELHSAPKDASPAERMILLGRITGAIAPSDAVALVHPLSERLGLFTTHASKALIHGFVEEALNPPDGPMPIAEIEGDDPQLVAAAEEANRRVGEFLTAFAQRQPDDTFAVKLPFSDESGHEYMWVCVTEIDENCFHGRLDHQPAFVKSLRAGQTVHVERSKLNDWIFVRSGEFHGGFTLKLLHEQQVKKESRTDDAK